MSGNHDHNGEHHPEPQSYAALRTKAIESLLIEKGLLSTDAIDCGCKHMSRTSGR